MRPKRAPSAGGLSDRCRWGSLGDVAASTRLITQRSFTLRSSLRYEPAINTSAKFQGTFQLRVLVASGFRGAADPQLNKKFSENVIATQTRVRIPLSHQIDGQSDVEDRERRPEMKHALEPETFVASQAVGSMGVFAYGQDGSPTTPKGARARHCLEEPSGFLDSRVSQSGREPGSTSTGTDPRAAASQPAAAPPMGGGGESPNGTETCSR